MYPPREKRKTLLVLPAAQRKIVRHVATVPLLVLAVTFGAAIVPWVLYVDGGSETLSSALFLLPALFVWAAVVTAVGWWIVRRALRLSNRIAGPLDRLTQLFACVAGGDFSVRMQPRDDDVFMEPGIEFNRMMDTLAKRCTYRAPEPEPAPAPARQPREEEPEPLFQALTPRGPIRKGVVLLPELED